MKASKKEMDIILLARSVKHWFRVIEGEDKPYGSECPLCNHYRTDCMKCPVGIHVKSLSCANTPYSFARQEWEMNLLAVGKTQNYQGQWAEYVFLWDLTLQFVKKLVDFDNAAIQRKDVENKPWAIVPVEKMIP